MRLTAQVLLNRDVPRCRRTPSQGKMLAGQIQVITKRALVFTGYVTVYLISVVVLSALGMDNEAAVGIPTIGAMIWCFFMLLKMRVPKQALGLLIPIYGQYLVIHTAWVVAGSRVSKPSAGGFTTVINELDGQPYSVATLKGPMTGVWETLVVEDIGHPRRSQGQEPERLASVFIVTPDQIPKVPSFAKDKCVPVVKADDGTVARLHVAVILMVQKRPRQEWQDFIVVGTCIALTELGLTPLTKDQLGELTRFLRSPESPL